MLPRLNLPPLRRRRLASTAQTELIDPHSIDLVVRAITTWARYVDDMLRTDTDGALDVGADWDLSPSSSFVTRFGRICALQGLLENTSGGAVVAPSTLCTVAPGFRPTVLTVVYALNIDTLAPIRVDVLPSGVVEFASGPNVAMGEFVVFNGPYRTI